MNKEFILKYKPVFDAWLEGKEIEIKLSGVWKPISNIHWSFAAPYPEMRIKPVPDQIDWNHVSKEFKYMVRNKSGYAILFKNKPQIFESSWGVKYAGEDFVFASCFASYIKGTTEWNESLVERPL